MTKSKYRQPTFHLALLHPKYWGVWFGFGLLALLVNLLPYALLLPIGRGLGQVSMRFGQARVKVARRNLALAFPAMSESEIHALVLENFKNTGAALIETGIAWFWPTCRFKQIVIDQDTQALRRHAEQGKGVLLCCVHALNLEIAARGFGVLGMGGYGVYRPHNNPAYNFIQNWGRTHNGNQLINRKDIRSMLKALRQGQRVFYLADHDYGRNKSVFVPFFAVPDACTTTGTSILACTSGCAIVLGSGFRNAQGRYEIMADISIEANYPANDTTAAATYMNKYLEQLILRAPEQWMWLHKRFKTMPDPTHNHSRYR